MVDNSWRPDGDHAHEHNRGHEIRQQTICGSNNSFYACAARHKKTMLESKKYIVSVFWFMFFKFVRSMNQLDYNNFDAKINKKIITNLSRSWDLSTNYLWFQLHRELKTISHCNHQSSNSSSLTSIKWRKRGKKSLRLSVRTSRLTIWIFQTLSQVGVTTMYIVWHLAVWNVSRSTSVFLRMVIFAYEWLVVLTNTFVRMLIRLVNKPQQRNKQIDTTNFGIVSKSYRESISAYWWGSVCGIREIYSDWNTLCRALSVSPRRCQCVCSGTTSEKCEETI